jgi:hypothetical protein
VPFAKAHSGLFDAELREMDAIIRRATVETFGPVRSVKPTQVISSASRASRRAGGTRAAWRCAFPTCSAGGAANPSPRPTCSMRFAHCGRRDAVTDVRAAAVEAWLAEKVDAVAVPRYDIWIW